MADLKMRMGIGVLIAVLATRELGQVEARDIMLDFGRLFSTPVHMSVMKESDSKSGSVLTAKTVRVDPLNYFKNYRGGYNITNKHYWSSVIFTGKYGYSIAALWLTGGLFYAGVLISTTICFNKKSRRETEGPDVSFKKHRLFSILIGIFFTVLAIVASVVVLVGSSRFHSSAESVKGVILATENEATGTIYNATENVRAMQVDKELYHYLKGYSHLNSTLHKLNAEAGSIKRKAEKNMSLMNEGLKILKSLTITTVVLNLTVVLGLMASAPLRLRRVLHVLISISWVLTVLFWVYFGFYFFIDKFSSDTCVALDEYRQDPKNSSLRSVLPCSDRLSTSSSLLRDAGAEIHDIIDIVNAHISELQSSSLPGLKYVCNPISGPPEYSYQPKNCSSNTIQIGDIPQILTGYICSQDDDGSCGQGEFISASDYSRVLIYTSSIQRILYLFPSMERLVNCQLVQDAISKILKQCKQLKKYSRTTFAALAVLSTTMVALVLSWTIEAHSYNRRSGSFDGSVEPQVAQTVTLDQYEMISKQREDKREA